MFDPLDDSSYYASRSEILEEFTAWMTTHDGATSQRASEVANDVATALEWKWAYQDGNLASWHVSHVADYLLAWCPRQLSVLATECDGTREALGHWLRFLAAKQLLSPESDPLTSLLEAVESLRDDFIAAMGDTRYFGVAKSLFALGSEAGVDMSDPDQIGAFIERFNNLSIEERGALLPDHLFANPGAPPPTQRFAPVIVSSDREVAESLARAPILAKFRDLAAFLAEGRRLTKKGNLTLADARVLVELLDTGDEMDPRYGNATFRTTSSDDLSGLRLIVAWAKKAGVVRVRNGKLVATKRGVGMAKDPSREFNHVIDALFEAGPLALQSWPSQWATVKAIWGSVEDMSIDLLTVPLVMMTVIPVETLTDAATGEVLAEWRFGADDETIRRYVASAVDRMIDAFELGGLLTRENALDTVEGTASEESRVALTPAGVVTVRRLLIAAGFDVPRAGEFVALSLNQLFETLHDEDEEFVRAELLAWCRARDLAEAIGDVARALADLDDPARQIEVLEVLAELDVAGAAVHVRELATRPETAGFSLAWLADRHLIEEEDLWERAGPVAFLDVLVHRILVQGPEGLLRTLALVGNDRAQCAWLDTTWRIPSPSVLMVLTVTDQIHPSKVVRKAARKALFKRRSAVPPS